MTHVREEGSTEEAVVGGKRRGGKRNALVCAELCCTA